MLSTEEQEAQDRALALQLQREEFQPQIFSRAQPDSDHHVSAPLLDSNLSNNNNNNNNNNNQPSQEPNRLPRNNGNNQERIRRNVMESVRESESESPRLLLFRIAASLIEIIATATVLAIGWNDYCGEPLKWWILIFTSRHLIDRPLRIHIYRLRRIPNVDPTRLEKTIQLIRWLGIFTFLLFLAGNSFLFTGKSCSNTSPTIWYYCLVIIILNYILLTLPFLIVLAICICLPCVLIVFRWFAEPEGADLEAIKKLPTRKIQANDLLIQSKPKETKKETLQQEKEKNDEEIDHDHEKNQDIEEEEEDDDGDKPSCAICMIEYKIGDEIRTLPCKHEFHIECVDKWLPMKKVCPLCRHDITQPLNSADAEHAASQPNSNSNSNPNSNANNPRSSNRNSNSRPLLNNNNNNNNNNNVSSQRNDGLALEEA